MKSADDLSRQKRDVTKMIGAKYIAMGFGLGVVIVMTIFFTQSRLKQTENSTLPSTFLRNIRPLVAALTNKNSTHKEEQSKLRDIGASPVFSAMSKLDKNLQGKGLPDIIELEYEPIEIKKGMSQIDMEDAMVALSLQRQVICPNWEMYGLQTDGGWPVCKAKALIPKKPCHVYSFGIRNDWSFDDAYRAAHGCIIRTFDPSMGKTREHVHKPGVFFYPVGLSDKKGVLPNKWKMDTYGGLLKRFREDNKTIAYLKFDIDTMEWIVLKNMLDDGFLKHVMQLSFELHVDVLQNVRGYFQLIKGLEAIGFRRWFYHHRLNGYSLQVDNSYININYLK